MGNVFNDIGYLLENYFHMFVYGLLSTLILAIFGTVVGLLLGIFLAFGKNITVKK